MDERLSGGEEKKKPHLLVTNLYTIELLRFCLTYINLENTALK